MSFGHHMSEIADGVNRLQYTLNNLQRENSKMSEEVKKLADEVNSLSKCVKLGEEKSDTKNEPLYSFVCTHCSTSNHLPKSSFISEEKMYGCGREGSEWGNFVTVMCEFCKKATEFQASGFNVLLEVGRIRKI